MITLISVSIPNMLSFNPLSLVFRYVGRRYLQSYTVGGGLSGTVFRFKGTVGDSYIKGHSMILILKEAFSDYYIMFLWYDTNKTIYKKIKVKSQISVNSVFYVSKVMQAYVHYRQKVFPT